MFQARMRAVASRCDLRVYPGQPHGFFNYRTGDNPYYYQTLAECDRFLQSLGYLKGNPSPHPRTHRPRKPVWLRRSRKPGAASPASW
jgi:dienelactone hydrolase